MSIDSWQTIGIVCGAILAALTLVGFVWRKVVLPVFRVIKRLNVWLDSVNGDKDNGVPSLVERVKSIEAGQHALDHALDEHLSWHRATGRTNGPAPAERAREAR